MDDRESWYEPFAPMLSVGAPPGPGVYTALGPSGLPAWFLASLVPALGAGKEVWWIDAGNAFDAYGAARRARELSLDPSAALRRVRLARAFNVFQLETMAGRTLPPLWRGEPVVLSDPLAPLFDEDLPAAEARKAARRIHLALQRLPAVWLVLGVLRKPPPGRERVLDELLAVSRGLAFFDAPAGRLLDARSTGPSRHSWTAPPPPLQEAGAGRPAWR